MSIKNTLENLSIRDSSLNLRAESINVQSLSIAGNPFNPNANNWNVQTGFITYQSTQGGASIGTSATNFCERTIASNVYQINMWSTTSTITPTSTSDTLYFNLTMNTGYTFHHPNSPTGIPVLITNYPMGSSPPTIFIKGVLFFSANPSTYGIIKLESNVSSGTQYSLQSIFCNYVGIP